MIDVTRFTVPELVKLKELTDSSRSALHTLCSSRKTCTGCQWNTLAFTIVTCGLLRTRS